MFVENELISEAVKTIRTYICFTVMFGSSSHESGQVFNESVMLGRFVTQKEEMDSVFTVTVSAYVQWNQFPIFICHDANRYVRILILEFRYVLHGEWKRKTVSVQLVQIGAIVMCATRIIFVVNWVKSSQNGIQETLFVF